MEGQEITHKSNENGSSWLKEHLNWTLYAEIRNEFFDCSLTKKRNINKRGGNIQIDWRLRNV